MYFEAVRPPFSLFTRKEIQRADTLTECRFHASAASEGEGKKKRARTWPTLPPLPIPTGPLGIGPESGSGAFCMENNSVPGLFGNVAVDGNLNSKGEIDWIRERERANLTEGE